MVRKSASESNLAPLVETLPVHRARLPSTISVAKRTRMKTANHFSSSNKINRIEKGESNSRDRVK